MSLLFLKWEHLSQSGEHDASSQRSEGTLGRKWVTLLDVDKRKSTHVLQKYLLSRYYVTNHKLDARDQILSINKYNTHQFSSVQFSRSVMSESLWPHGLKHARLPCPSPTPVACSDLCPWISDAIQPSHFLSSPSPPTSNLAQHQGLFQWVSSSHQVAKVFKFQLQHESSQWIFWTDFLYTWLVLSPCSPRDSQDSSPIPEFKSNHSSAISFLYTPTLTSIHDYWKNYSFD